MKILIVKTSSLGDIIHTFPVLEYLKKVCPGARIDWVVESSSRALVEAHPYINKVHCIETKVWRKAKGLGVFGSFLKELRSCRYDVLFDFQGNSKSALVTALAKATVKAGFGRHTISEWPGLMVTNFKADPDKSVNVRQENLFLAQSYFKDSTSFFEQGVLLNLSNSEKDWINKTLSHSVLEGRRKVMVCPGSAWTNKQMKPATLISFLQKLHKAYPVSFLPIWGSEEEREIAKRICGAIPHSLLVDKQTLPCLQNLMDRMDLVIAMDSLPLHLAGTTSTKTFSVFGASSSTKYMPLGERHFSYQGECPYGRVFNRRCPVLRTCATGACIKDLDAERLFSRLEQAFPEL